VRVRVCSCDTPPQACHLRAHARRERSLDTHRDVIARVIGTELVEVIDDIDPAGERDAAV
jgi:hypothetical protein